MTPELGYQAIGAIGLPLALLLVVLGVTRSMWHK